MQSAILSVVFMNYLDYFLLISFGAVTPFNMMQSAD